MDRDRLRLADLLTAHGEEFHARYGATLPSEARRALRDVQDCRTAALGGHARRCPGCGHIEVYYNSCGNRHCPGCGAAKRAAWLDREADLLLPVEYHHVVFTLPAALHELTRRHPRQVYELLFRTTSATIREVAADPKYLGAQVGLLLALHTWGQNLHLHPHVHGIVSGGGLSCDRAGLIEPNPRWVSCRPGFFLPVRVLSRVYRGKFVAGLRAAYARGVLAGFADAAAFAGWLRQLYRHDWVVYAQPPAAGPAVVLKYLARYVARTALSESRLVALGEGRVTFTVKDYADGGRHKELTLDAVEFLRRWTQHVLPRGFVAVRHYGLLANRGRDEKRALCRRLLWPRVALGAPGDSVAEPAVLGPYSCPRCGAGPMAWAGEVAAAGVGWGLAVVGTDSS
jgi:Putative transposase/Transposase zinc-binding domain